MAHAFIRRGRLRWNVNEFAKLVKPRVVPPLHECFSPAVLANHAYLKAVRDSGKGVPLTIALGTS